MIAVEYHQARRARMSDRLVLAVVVSLLAHLLLFGGWQLGRYLGWKEIPLPRWLKSLSLSKLLAPRLDEKKLLKPLRPVPPPPEREIALTFVEVDPVLAIMEPPPNAKYYSTHSTKAANPNPKIESNNPQIDGKQTRIVKTVEAPKPVVQPEPKPPAPKVELKPKEEPPPLPTPPQLAKVQPPPQPAPKAEPQPLQPTVAPSPEKPAEAKAKPAPTEPRGDLAMIKPPPPTTPKPSEGKSETDKGNEFDPKPPAPRPRTLAEALSRPENSAIASQRTKQDGGVRNVGHVAIDARGTSFGAYDLALVRAVEKRWNDLLVGRSTPRGGTVVVTFRLHYDGRVTDVKMPECDVGDLLGLICQKAIIDPAPFARWPSDMRRQMANDYRDVRFTFFYN